MDTKPSTLYIGERIKAEVDRRHWQYSAFAREINCSRSTLYNIFSGHDVGLLKLLRICEVLGCSVASLLEAPATAATEAALVIPLRDGRPDLSHLPGAVLALLRAELDRK